MNPRLFKIITGTLFLVHFFTAGLNGQVFTFVSNTAIPDDGTALQAPMVITNLPATIDSSYGLVMVYLTASHTWDSDMEFRLIAPGGQQILLFSGVGGDGDNFTNTYLDQSAVTPISQGTAPFSGYYQPMGNLGNLNNGQNPNGTWILQCYDTYPFADAGFLFSWSLRFGPNAPAPYVFPGTSLPLLRISTLLGQIPNDPKVEAFLEVIDHTDGTLNLASDTPATYSSRIMIELQGFTGPSYPKKNYDFDLIDAAGSDIDTTLLGLPAENDWILKAEYLDSTLLNNSIAYEFTRRMGRYAPRTRFCELFIDGDYLGVYTLTEKVKRGTNRVDLARLKPEDLSGDDLTGGYIFEMNINGDPPDWTSAYLPVNDVTCDFNVEFKHVYPKSSEIQPVQHEYIRAFTDSLEASFHQPDFADPETGYRQWMDEASFIDFMLVNELGTNYDSYGRSTYLYKDKQGRPDSLIHIGPPWDFDRAFMDIENWVWEQTHPYWPFPDWWAIMHTDTLFLKHEWCRWHSLRTEVFATPEFDQFIDSLRTLIGVAAERNFARWPELGYTHWDASVTNLKVRLGARLDWMDANLAGNYDCGPPPTAIHNPGMAACTIFPNPAADHISIRPGSELRVKGLRIQVLNSLLQPVIPEQTLPTEGLTLDLSGWPCGLYYFVLEGENRIWGEKWIKSSGCP